MEPQCRPRSELDLAQRLVLVQHIHHAQLIDVQPRMRRQLRLQNLRPQINVRRRDQRPDARPLVPLLDLVPPAVDLVFDHRRLFHQQHRARKQIEQRARRAAHTGEEFPSRKDRNAARGNGLFHQLRIICRRHARSAQPRVYRRQQPFRHRRLGQRQQPRFIQRRRRALRLRIEFPDRLNLVAEKLKPHRPVCFRRIDVEDAAAPRELPRHLHHIHARVADACQVRQQRLDVDFFAAPQHQGQPRVEGGREQLHRRRFHRRHHNRRLARSDLPQRFRPLFLNVRMG